MLRGLAQLHGQGMRSLVLDLRDDPGGLLDQAVRVADAFLSNGTIVTTDARDPRQRDEKFAREEDTEPSYPMIVLTNGGSASASEIVAGALKAHDRALIVGQRTFGKGSVQVLYDFDDGSALKLTIAQYLTPGDVSIQGVGIVPDIAIDPMTVDREDMDLLVDSDYVRESDLRMSLTSNHARDGDRPEMVFRYYIDREQRQRQRERDPDDPAGNEQEEEFLLRFATEILGAATRSGRREMLADARAVIQRVSDTEMGHAVTALRGLGVDWSTGADAGPSAVDVVVSTSRPDNRATAGEALDLRVRVTNRGTATLYQLRATTKSDFRLFSGRELVFGRLAPGESREWTTPLGICETENGRRACPLPRDVSDRADGVRIEFEEAHGHAPPPAEIRTEVRSLARPQFAYDLQIADNVRGNGDGRVQRGESLTMYLRFKNVGRGPSFRPQANLRNLSGRGVLLHDGRFELPDVAPGEERVVAFTLQVLADFDRDEAKLEVSIADLELREYVTENVLVDLTGAPGAVAARTGAVVLRDGATLRAGPSGEAAPVARVERGPLGATAQAESGGFVRVDVGEGRPAWAATSDLVATGTGGRLAWSVSHMPPELEVDFGGTLVTRDATLPIRGRARDDTLVRDLYVFVGGRKVYYASNAHSPNRREAAFEATIPLQGGINYVTVFARESNDVISRRTIVVRRDGADGSLLETPAYDDDVFGIFHDEPAADD
jgi:carboxyl-terminal processing protease